MGRSSADAGAALADLKWSASRWWQFCAECVRCWLRIRRPARCCRGKLNGLQVSDGRSERHNRDCGEGSASTPASRRSEAARTNSTALTFPSTACFY